jgi:transposase-like protein
MDRDARLRSTFAEGFSVRANAYSDGSYYLTRKVNEPMTCPCGASLKCIRRHPKNPAFDEYRCDDCGRTFYRYQINKLW